MINYNWRVANYFVRLSADGLTNVVHKVGWTVTADRDGQTVGRMGVTDLPPASPATFVPWEEVTDAMALAWVQAELANQPGLSDINGDVLDGLAYVLSNLQTELDNLPPPTVTMPPKDQHPEPAGDE